MISKQKIEKAVKIAVKHLHLLALGYHFEQGIKDAINHVVNDQKLLEYKP